MRRLCIVPRWGGGPTSDFYPWLERAVKPGIFDEVVALAMPDPSTPTVDGWVGRLSSELGRDPSIASQTVLLGHSVGCQALLHYLASLPDGVRYRGALLVAGWLWIDRPWETIRPWLDAPPELARASIPLRARRPPVGQRSFHIGPRREPASVGGARGRQGPPRAWRAPFQ